MGLEINTDLFEAGDEVYYLLDMSMSVWTIVGAPKPNSATLLRVLHPLEGSFTVTSVRKTDLRPVDDFEFWVRQVRHEASNR